MSIPRQLFEQEPDALKHYLLAHARREVAPDAARARACANVVLVGAAVAAPSVAAHAAASSAAGKLGAALVLKWVVVGLASGLLVLGSSLAVHDVVSARRAPDNAIPRAKAQDAASVRPAAAGPAPGGSADLANAKPTASEVPWGGRRQVVEGATPGSDVSPLDSSALVAPPAPDAVPSLTASGSFATVDPSGLARELQLLERARLALARSSPAAARQALDLHDREFAGGALQIEAAALRVEAVSASGQGALAQQLAQVFLARYPQSALSARVRALSVAVGRAAHKP